MPLVRSRSEVVSGGRRRLALAAIALVALGARRPRQRAPCWRAIPSPRGPQGVHITPLSKGTIGASVHAQAAGIEITTHGRKDILVTAITVDPGGSFGWHSHPGPVLVAVGKGTLTVFDATKHGCRRSTVTAGDAFVEDGHHVHLARNEGSVPSSSTRRSSRVPAPPSTSRRSPGSWAAPPESGGRGEVHDSVGLLLDDTAVVEEQVDVAEHLARA